MGVLFRFIPKGDIDIQAGKVQLVSGRQYVRQKIASRLKFFLGEWFRDQRLGIPYYRVVFIMNPDLDVIRSLYRNVILSVQEVTRVENIELDYDKTSRKMAVGFDAFLDAGETLLVRQPDPAFIVDFAEAA